MRNWLVVLLNVGRMIVQSRDGRTLRLMSLAKAALSRFRSDAEAAEIVECWFRIMTCLIYVDVSIRSWAAHTYTSDPVEGMPHSHYLANDSESSCLDTDGMLGLIAFVVCPPVSDQNVPEERQRKWQIVVTSASGAVVCEWQACIELTTDHSVGVKGDNLRWAVSGHRRATLAGRVGLRAEG